MEKTKSGIKKMLKEQYEKACNGYLCELLRMWELADRAGLTRQHIGRIEKGELVSVAYVTIQQIAEALSMTVDIVDGRLRDLAPLRMLTAE